VIEDVGVRGHRSYAMTENDLVKNNEDLLAFCGEILAQQPSTAMRVSSRRDEEIGVETRGLDRLDVYVEDRPHASLEITDGTSNTAVPAGWSTIELVGFAGGQVRQRRHVRR
jgi:hypothetical protein